MIDVVETMAGLGDCVYTRTVVRNLLAQGREVYVRTCWPQVFVDLPVKCLPFPTELRTQRRNVERGWAWADYPSGSNRIHPSYSWGQGLSLPRALASKVGVPAEGDFSFSPPWSASKGKKPLAIVIPPTVRTEWPNVARPCDPCYMQQLITEHRGFDWVEVSDLDPPKEVLFGQPLVGVRHAGDLSTEQLIGLLATADVIVTGVGYGLPLGIALRVPTLCLFGGDIPERLLVEDWMIGAPYASLQPHPFCECGIRGRHTERGVCNRDLWPHEVERAFRQVAFKWDTRRDYGHWPVHINGQYNKDYFENYRRLEQTEMGAAINAFRVDWVKQHFGEQPMVDIGVGSCQFVKATHALGADINPASVQELQRLGRYVDLETLASTGVLTFWDSLEHIHEPETLLSVAKVGVAVSMPIYRDREHALSSRHFKPHEHIHYWTHESFASYMWDQGFMMMNFSDHETELGRDGIRTYAFARREE